MEARQMNRREIRSRRVQPGMRERRLAGMDLCRAMRRMQRGLRYTRYPYVQRDFEMEDGSEKRVDVRRTGRFKVFRLRRYLFREKPCILVPLAAVLDKASHLYKSHAWVL